MIGAADVAILRCPACGGEVELNGRAQRAAILRCHRCGFCTLERDGLFDLHIETAVRGTDRWMRMAYNALGAPLQHDFGVRFALPLVQDGVTEAAMRARFLRPLSLERLRPRADGEPLRVLEVGMGTGSNFPEVLARVPRDVPVEIWGCDLSPRMLQRGAARLRRWRFRGTDGRPPRMLIADAHALPFASGSFDRVFHLGGIGVFRDRGLAMREMARVARPGCEIVVGDESLDPARWHSPLHHLWFFSLTALDRAPYPPRDQIPPGCAVIADEQISRFYYCLGFRTPSATGPRA